MFETKNQHRLVRSVKTEILKRKFETTQERRIIEKVKIDIESIEKNNIIENSSDIVI